MWWVVRLKLRKTQLAPDLIESHSLKVDAALLRDHHFPSMRLGREYRGHRPKRATGCDFRREGIRQSCAATCMGSLPSAVTNGPNGVALCGSKSVYRTTADGSARAPADGTPKQKADARRAQFKRALDWAEAQELIASHEIDGVVYLRLCSHEAGEPNE